MVHNGIEYGDMQLICEAYHLMKETLGLTPQEMGNIFEEWNKSELDSFLIEITKDIMKFKDNDCKPLVEKILDSAGQVSTEFRGATSNCSLLAERHRQVDCHLGPRLWHARHSHWGVGLCSLSLLPKGRACPGE